MKLADTIIGGLWLPRLRTRMTTLIEEHPGCGLTIDQVFAAINTDVPPPQAAEEIRKQIDMAISLCASLADDVLAADTASRKRAAARPASAGAPEAAAGGAGRGAVVAGPVGGSAGYAAPGPPAAGAALVSHLGALPAVSAMGPPPTTFSFDDGSALGTVRTLAAAKMGDDIRSAFDDRTSPAAQVFSPLLAELNDAMRESAKGLEKALHFMFDAGQADLLTMPVEEIEKLNPPALSPLPQAMQVLCMAREAYADMRGRMTQLCKLWWLSVHTRGCSFETAKQILFRQQHDIHAMRVDPTATPLTDWPTMVREAMGVLGQAAGVSKDGNPLGPVAPGLQTFVQRNRTAAGRQGQPQGQIGDSAVQGRGGAGEGRRQYPERSDRRGYRGGGGGRGRRGNKYGRGAAATDKPRRKKAAAKADAGEEAPEAAADDP